MQVTPSSAQGPVIPLQTKTGATRAAGGTASSSSSADSADGSSFAMTGELAQLLAAVHEAPDVRAEAVAAASAMMASGELDTPQAAAGAAAAMLAESAPAP